MKKFVSVFLKCLLVLFALGLIMFSCCETKKISEYGINVTKVQLEAYDTISSQSLNKMIIEKKIPSLDKWQTTELTNYEENTTYVFYFYYDKEHEKMMSLKRLINNKKDTAYVYVSKMLKFEK